MKLSEAKSDIRPLAVTFPGGAVLNIKYRTPEYTPYELAAMVDTSNPDPTRIIAMVCKVVDEWDLEYDDGQKDADDNPLEGLIPLTDDGVGNYVHVGILRKIMEAINKDQMPGEAQETSVAG